MKMTNVSLFSSSLFWYQMKNKNKKIFGRKGILFIIYFWCYYSDFFFLPLFVGLCWCVNKKIRQKRFFSSIAAAASSTHQKELFFCCSLGKTKKKKKKNFNSYPISNTNGTEQKKTRRKKKLFGLGKGGWGKSGWRLKKKLCNFFSFSVGCLRVLYVLL